MGIPLVPGAVIPFSGSRDDLLRMLNQENPLGGGDMFIDRRRDRKCQGADIRMRVLCPSGGLERRLKQEQKKRRRSHHIGCPFLINMTKSEASVHIKTCVFQHKGHSAYTGID